MQTASIEEQLDLTEWMETTCTWGQVTLEVGGNLTCLFMDTLSSSVSDEPSIKGTLSPIRLKSAPLERH
ncbi:Uncharacterized protein HZ326_3975 [Fusarium oxysporum f. sp. albedinis]|nr:Uncharacterized protein HZ326_3975 [Fusarium oxysporum f. sp. albedinis]